MSTASKSLEKKFRTYVWYNAMAFRDKYCRRGNNLDPVFRLFGTEICRFNHYFNGYYQICSYLYRKNAR